MISALMLFCAVVAEAPKDDVAKRESYLQELNATLPASAPWQQWQETTHELPPDFSAMPSSAELPDPLLRSVDGKPVRVTDAAQWQARRAELLEQFQHWILGTVPPPPGNVEGHVIAEHAEAGATSRTVELRFGPDHKAKLTVELLIPQGAGPFPVFITQENHHQWALIALRRGYLACVLAACDSHDDTDTFLDAFPGYDWSRLTRRGWAVGRCIDYLASVPQARMDQIATTGHSRNGKSSLIASALDERIAVVISSSSGVGGSVPSRYCGEPEFGEGIENITRAFPEWFNPRWRFFAGREQKCPIDLHELVALSAPRACLISSAMNDGVESTWAIEKTYLGVKPVYTMLGHEDRFRILWRQAAHETWPTIIERYVDWCDLQFGRGKYAFPERLIHPHDWAAWSKSPEHAIEVAKLPSREFGIAYDTKAAWEKHRAQLSTDVRVMLGDLPPTSHSPVGSYGEDPDHIESLLGHSAGDDLEKHDLVFGDYINADVYMPKGTKESGKKLPAVLWLHPVSNARGYVAAYKRGEQAFRTFAKSGYAVFCYDQLGYGRRIEEVEDFYTRYPNDSLLDRMVLDARAALDAMNELPFVDAQKIYVVGYGLGAMVALHLAPFDDRPAGYALVSPPTPFRLDSDIAETGGLKRWAQDSMLLPRLGWFVGEETRVPYDIDELLATMAPKPVFVLSPRYDRENPIALTDKSVTAARAVFKLYDAESKLTQSTPEAYNHFDPTIQKLVVDWLTETT